MTRFLREHPAAGAALAVGRQGKLVYARGFGYADTDKGLPVQPRSRFRIASISKPITAAAILRLIAMGKLKLDSHAFDLLDLEPSAGKESDPRLKKITIRQLLQHTAGWDQYQSFDPMFRPLAIAKELGTKAPPQAEQVVRYMLGQKLEFEPGSRFVYSNFGYCVLGRVIEKVSGKPYETFVKEQVLAPLGIRDMEIGKTLETAKDEVHYYDENDGTGRPVVGPRGKKVPTPYGTWYLEAMDAHGGWIASAPDLVRFASALERGELARLLGPAGVKAFAMPPPGPLGLNAKGKTKKSYYGLGWQVTYDGAGQPNLWHTGSLDGTSTILVHRPDGLSWAVLFNQGADANGNNLAGEIDAQVHEAAARVQRWPERDLFGKTL